MIDNFRVRLRNRRAGGKRSDERGAVLILVLVVMIVGGLLVGALCEAAVDDLHNTNNFSAVRNVDADAQSAVTQAIQDIRYAPQWSATLNASPPGPCWGTGTSTYSSPNNLIEVFCSTTWMPEATGTVWTRTVTVSACEYGAPPISAAVCAANPLAQAVVSFDDYPPGLSTPSPAECNSYCGDGGMEVLSMVDRPVVPTVFHVGTGSNGSQAATGPISGGTTITIDGSGFIPNGDTVDFVEESGGSAASDNIVLESASVSYVTSDVITAVTPPAVNLGEGSTYFVTVTTPTGTSPYKSAAASAFMTFTYTDSPSSSAPTVTSITPNSGPTSGGTNVVIDGTNFLDPCSAGESPTVGSCSSVTFVDESNPANSFAATDAELRTGSGITAGTEMTVVSPGIIADSKYYVEVTTPAGTSATGTADVFTYSPLWPEVTGVNPTSGVGPTSTTSSQITVSGENFYTGDSVFFVEDDSGTANTNNSYTVNNSSQTNVVVESPTQLTVNLPQTNGGVYFIEVCYPSSGTCNSPTSSTAEISEPETSAVFSYIPKTTSISPGSGSDPDSATNPAITQSVVLTGYNFFLPSTCTTRASSTCPTVTFTPTTGGSANSVTITSSADVNSQGTQLTVPNVPQITSGTTTYYVSVSDAGGTETPTSLSPVFTYLPTVTSAAYSSSNARITVTGQLIAGATQVQLVPTNSQYSTVTLSTSQFSESGSTITIGTTGLGLHATNYVVIVSVGSAASTSTGTAGINQFNY